VSSNDRRALFPQLEAVIEGQKRGANQLAAFAARDDFIESSCDRPARRINRLQETRADIVAELRKHGAEVQRLHGRLDAMSERLDDRDSRIGRLSDDVRSIRSERVGQYNEILNVVQAGTRNNAGIADLTERVEELERQFAARFGPA
jgi:chromosome segregation ATPase